MAASLLPNRPKQGEKGGTCVVFAGPTSFGIRFGADSAKDIWTNTKPSTGGLLTYTKHDTMPERPCCIVWGNGTAGHVGVVELSTGVGDGIRYRFSDSNRAPDGDGLVDVKTGLKESELKALISGDNFLGYVKFK